MHADALYNSLSTRVMGDLVALALAIGIAAVAFSYIRRALMDEGWVSTSDLWRHLMLIFSITMFVVFIDIAYQIESFRGERAAHTELEPSQVDAASTFLPRVRLLVLLPVDIIGIALIASLFGVLLVFATNQEFWSGPSASTLLEVYYLLVLTIAWHLAMIGWWVVFWITSVDFKGASWDISVHAAFILIELVTLIAIRFVRKSERLLRSGNVMAWIAATAYSVIVLAFYLIKLWDYSSKFIET